MEDCKVAKDIVPGDVVIAEDGELLEILSVRNGIYEGGRALHHKRGWSDVHRLDKIAVKPTPEVEP